MPDVYRGIARAEDQFGTKKLGAVVKIVAAGTDNPEITPYLQDGVTVIPANQRLTDNSGVFEFYAPIGDYDALITKNGVTVRQKDVMSPGAAIAATEQIRDEASTAAAQAGGVIRYTRAELEAALTTDDIGKVGTAVVDETNGDVRTAYDIIDSGGGVPALDVAGRVAVDVVQRITGAVARIGSLAELAAFPTTDALGNARRVDLVIDGKTYPMAWSGDDQSALYALVEDAPNQRFCVPPTGEDGSGGAWLYQYSGAVPIDAFGVVADYSGGVGTDNATEFDVITGLLESGDVSTLEIPSGSILSTSALGNANAGNINLRGQGILKSEIVFRNTDGLGNRFYCSIRDLTISGESRLSGQYTGVTNRYQCEFQNVRITNWHEGLSNAQSLKSAKKLYIDTNIFGITVDGGAGFSDSGIHSEIWLNNNVIGCRSAGNQILNYSFLNVFAQANVIHYSLNNSAVLTRQNCWHEQAGATEEGGISDTPNTLADTTLVDAVDIADGAGVEFEVDDASYWPPLCIAVLSPTSRTDLTINGGEWVSVSKVDDTHLRINERGLDGTTVATHASSSDIYILPTSVVLGSTTRLLDVAPYFSGSAQGGDVRRLSDNCVYRAVQATEDLTNGQDEYHRVISTDSSILRTGRSRRVTVSDHTEAPASPEVMATITMPPQATADTDNRAYQQAYVTARVCVAATRTDSVGIRRYGTYTLEFALRRHYGGSISASTITKTTVEESTGWTSAPSFDVNISGDDAEIRLDCDPSGGVFGQISASCDVDILYQSQRWNIVLPEVI